MAPFKRAIGSGLGGILLCAVGSAQATERVSIATGGTQSDAGSQNGAASADGRYVTFASLATNLVAGDSNGRWDVFVRDRIAETTERVSLSTGGAEGDADSGNFGVAISPDGRFVAFASFAANLVAGDTNANCDIFVRDRQAGTTERVSISTGGAEPVHDCDTPAISADGRYVAFNTASGNLVPGDLTAGFLHHDIFVRDRTAGTLTCVSFTPGGVQGNGDNFTASLSADGRYVAFWGIAGDLIAGDTNGEGDIFVRDRMTGTLSRVSVADDEAQADDESFRPSISADGRYVAFMSEASNLVLGDVNAVGDVFVRDREAGTTQVVSRSNVGVLGNSLSSDAHISADGRFVAFSSLASNLVAGDTNATFDAFLHDRVATTTVRMSVSTGGAEADGSVGATSLSADGRCVVIVGLATNLVAGDTNAVSDVFVRDEGPPPILSSCFGDGSIGDCPCWNNGATGHGCENSSNTGGSILAASGTANLSSDTLLLTASGEKPSALSIFLQGNASIVVTNYGDGFRCTGGALKRLYKRNAVGGVVVAPQGTDPSISARSAALGDAIPYGATRHYQVYYRDPDPSFCPSPQGNTFNISNALSAWWGP